MKRLNDLIADKLSAAMATMTLFWLLLILDVAGAIVDHPRNVQAWLLWGVSILFQSVALPVLAFVSNKQAERTEKVLRETHDQVLSEFKELKYLHRAHHAELVELKTLQAEIARLAEHQGSLIKWAEEVRKANIDLFNRRNERRCDD